MKKTLVKKDIELPFEATENISQSWKIGCVQTESTMHQLSPYIGKLKTNIAKSLIEEFSKANDLILDPFAGSGTIPLEAKLQSRRVFASDINTYAYVLNIAKLSCPPTLEEAMRQAEKLLDRAAKRKSPDLRRVPAWVRKFFHPRTLKEAINFGHIARQSGNEFFLACFLGILHHQRPGFLSYPSSNLVPYLRDKKYPLNEYPEMYTYRDLRSRLIAKIRRAYKRYKPINSRKRVTVKRESVQNLRFPKNVDVIITSPPYMNALDYERDNRLRLWFVHPHSNHFVGDSKYQKKKEFISIITALAKKANKSLKTKGRCILIVGDRVSRTFKAHPSLIANNIMNEHAPLLHLDHVYVDEIPDIRRSRRDCRGIKTEHILIYKKY